MRGRDKTRRRPEEAEVRDALRSLSAVRPEPAYRDRMRRAFIDGTLEPAAGVGRVTEPSAGETAADRRTGPAPALTRWPFPRIWILAPAVAAAAILLVFVLNRGTPWSVMDASGSGSILVNGRPVAVSDVEAMNRSLGRGPTIRVPEDAELVLRSDVMLVDLAPGTEATLPSPPGRWIGRNLAATLEHGEVRVMTGDRFPGSRLRILTSEGTTELTGTIVSVYKEEPLTCVCVIEGSASVGIDAKDMEEIPAGMRKVLFADGSPPVVTEIEPEHAAGLVAFAARYESGWRTNPEAAGDSVPSPPR